MKDFLGLRTHRAPSLCSPKKVLASLISADHVRQSLPRNPWGHLNAMKAQSEGPPPSELQAAAGMRALATLVLCALEAVKAGTNAGSPDAAREFALDTVRSGCQC